MWFGASMIPARVIERKRDGETLDAETLEAFMNGYLAGEVEEYQMSAFLMSVVFRGMSEGELDALVRVMIDSGARLDLEGVGPARVDKHSTGGVGDKVSLVLAPLVAELGVLVPMMSGRGLGHTGGTLDKLEAIPGFRTDLSLDEFEDVLAEVGCAMIGQTAEIAPLDRRLYDLRSVTGTVACRPLIAASIMSKKLAEDLTGLVLDVKVGAGAFLTDPDEALELARTMVRIGRDYGVPTRAVATAMDRPLGRAIGNTLEAVEAFACLAGEGPAELREVVLTLAAEMAVLGGAEPDEARALSAARAALDDGRALRRMERLVEAQGGDPRVVTEPGLLGVAPVRASVRAPLGGVVGAIEPAVLGRAVVALGGGQQRLGERIDPAVGIDLRVALGDAVEEGGLLAEVHATDPGGAAEAERAVLEAVRVVAADEGPPAAALPLIGQRIGPEDV